MMQTPSIFIFFIIFLATWQSLCEKNLRRGCSVTKTRLVYVYTIKFPFPRVSFCWYLKGVLYSIYNPYIVLPKTEQKPFIMSVLCVSVVWCGPFQGKPAGCSAHPDHHRGQTAYVSLILYLTETKSIVSLLSGFMCVCHKKKKKWGKTGGRPLDGFMPQSVILKHVTCAWLV